MKLTPGSWLLPMLAPRAVVFDLDGLMFNTEELYVEVGTEILRRRVRSEQDFDYFM